MTELSAPFDCRADSRRTPGKFICPIVAPPHWVCQRYSYLLRRYYQTIFARAGGKYTSIPRSPGS